MSTKTSSVARLPTPEILRRQVVVEEHDLAPEGTFAILSRRIVEGEHYVSHLWLVAIDAAGRAGSPRRLTTGHVRDRTPAISPDGRRVAFTRCDPNDEEATASIRVLDLDGGEPVELSIGHLSASEIAWSPDGHSIAFTARTGPQRFVVGDKPTEGEPRARRVTRLDYRMDEVGYLDRASQLHLVPSDGTGHARQVTEVEGGVSGIAWRPDGGAIAFVADPRPEADLDPRSSIWSIDVGARRTGVGRRSARAEPREILSLAGPVRAPAWSPDGAWIAGIGLDVEHPLDDQSPTLFVAPSDASRHAVPLAPDLDRPIGNWADTDLTGWMTEVRAGPFWVGSATVVALVTDRGRTHPWRFMFDSQAGAAAGPPERLASGDVMCQTLAVSASRMTVTATVGARPPELCLVEASGTVRPLTSIGSRWSTRIAWPEMRCVEAPGPGGPIETWIASPAGAADVPLPTIVDVHGGPLGAWAPAPSLEVVLLCARGYRVVLPNIRGSASYGAEWIAPQLGDWGGVDAADVHAALDHAIDLGLADPERLGVLGLSYGGFMVNWLVGTTDRFRAAVSENGVTNQVSAWGHSDVGPDYCRAARMGDPTTPEGVERLWRQSPLRNVANIRTPLLMLQSEADRRCPVADNEQFFMALRWLRREVEFVLYPEEYHVVQATGRIDRRIDRMTRVLDWFDGHIPTTVPSA
jgi:dipeptidyl aminopeptidase/acylaminoacyl peptidase